MRDVAVWPAICWRRWSPAGHSPEHVDFRLERQAVLSRCGGFFLVVGSHRFFECGFTQPVGLTRPHLPEILPMIEVDGCWYEFPAVGRWREGDMGACNPLACECVVGCAVLVLRARPDVSNGCLQLFVGPPFISSRVVPVSSTAARLSRFSQQNHSLTHRQTCLSHLAPSRRIQHSAILRSCRQPPSFTKTTYIRIQLPIRPSVLSQQPVAGLSCVVYQAFPRSRPTVQQDSKNQHHPAIRVAPHYQIKLSMRTIRP